MWPFNQKTDKRKLMKKGGKQNTIVKIPIVEEIPGDIENLQELRRDELTSEVIQHIDEPVEDIRGIDTHCEPTYTTLKQVLGTTVGGLSSNDPERHPNLIIESSDGILIECEVEKLSPSGHYVRIHSTTNEYHPFWERVSELKIIEVLDA